MRKGSGRLRGIHGFTTIELLTVIAIIAVLAALLLPVLGRSKEKARQAQCLHNLEQIAVALKQYRDDKGAYPPPPVLVDMDGNSVFDQNDIFVGGVSSLVPDYLEPSQLLCPNDLMAAQESRPQRYSSYNGPTPVLQPGQNILPECWTYIGVPNPFPNQKPIRGGYNYWGYYGGTNDPSKDGLPVIGPDRLIIRTGNDPCGGLNWQANTAVPGAGGVQVTIAIESVAKFPRLGNRFAPETAFITHCWHHREAMSNTLDLVINLGGKGRNVKLSLIGGPSATTNPPGGIGWCYMPPL